MWDEIIKLALSNGLWAVLFCLLLIYELKDSRKRELKYQSTIAVLLSRLEIVESVKEDTSMLVAAKKPRATASGVKL